MDVLQWLHQSHRRARARAEGLARHRVKRNKLEADVESVVGTCFRVPDLEALLLYVHGNGWTGRASGKISCGPYRSYKSARVGDQTTQGSAEDGV